MEARLFKKDSKDCDYLLISIDEQGLFYLNQDMPLRVAFYLDNNKDLPQHKRKWMVAIIGKNLDFERHKTYTEGPFKRGLIDKSYLISYIADMKKKIAKMAIDEIDTFEDQLQLEDHTQEVLQASEEQSEPEPLEVISEPVEEPKEYISTDEASEILGISYPTLANLVNKEVIKGENNGNGWYFVRADIEKITKEQPEFLTKIWNDPKSLRSMEKINAELIFDNERYYHIDRAQKIIGLSANTIKKYVKLGLIRHKKERGKDYYVSTKHMEELKANPPDWLKKSWSYFNNGKEA